MAQETQRRLRWRRILLAVILLLIAAIVLPPLVNLNRYRREIATSISDSLGRTVTISSVSLRLLPLPALTLSNFVVAEQPGFGSEPMLYAGSVVAYLHISSLWRARPEIARIDLNHASLNLVREPDGTWNFGSALIRAARTPRAPTDEASSGKVHRFPYIEASHARINFKSGYTKEPFSFVDADVSIWLENSGRWGVHFRARPVRTDLEMDQEDTGTVHIDGFLQPAATLNRMPMDLELAWSNAQMGQVSRILLGRDAGWRGSLDFHGRIRGSAELARLKVSASISSLHRMEFMPDQALTLRSRCTAVYSKEAAAVGDISCRSQAGSGTLHLTGTIGGIGQRLQPDLVLSIKGIPASLLLQSIKEVRSDVDSGIKVKGDLQGNITYASHPTAQLAGTLRMDSLALWMPGASKPLELGPIRIACESAKSTSRSKSTAVSPAFLLEPVALAMGGKIPLTIDGRFTPSGFDLHLSGQGSLARLRRLDTILAWSGTSPARSSRAALGAGGSAALDVNLNGPWVLPFRAPGEPIPPFTATGSVTVKDADLVTSYLPRPVTIVSAHALLGPGTVAWTNTSIEYEGFRAKGTLEYPSLCASGQPCAAHFHLAARSLDLQKIQSSLRSSTQGEGLFQQLLSRIDGHPRVWPLLKGSFSVGALSAGSLIVRGATGTASIGDRSLTVEELNGKFLGGAMHLTGSMDLSSGQPRYSMMAQVEGASSNELAKLFHEKWGGGRLDLSAQWKMSGWNARELTGSAAGKMHWNWIRNRNERTMANRRRPFEFSNWSGDAILKDRSLEVAHSRLDRGGRTIPLMGKISFGGKLDLTSSPGAHAIAISGTLNQPRVTPAAIAERKTVEP